LFFNGILSRFHEENSLVFDHTEKPARRQAPAAPRRIKAMGKKRVIVTAAILLAAFCLGTGFFLFRAPALLVEDLFFEAIYGPVRLRKKQVLVSLSLMRPLKIVRIDENAGDDIAVFTVESAAEKPYCVIFAARYYNTALRYNREHPEIPVGVFRGRSPDTGNAGAENFTVFGTDQELDLYRAGRLSALLASEEEIPPPEEKIPNILVFQDDNIPGDLRNVFKRGLEDEGSRSNPRYLADSSQYQSGMPCDAAVIYGGAQGFFDQEGEIPAILFSWIDPALTPLKVKAIFDDSPLALAAKLVPLVTGAGGGKDDNGAPGEIPSEIYILSRKLIKRRLPEKMKRAAGAKLPEFPEHFPERGMSR
jgi:hypothetical protein